MVACLEPTSAVVQVKRKLLDERKTMKPVAEPARRKSHWDYVLEEMKWMANDFWQVQGPGVVERGRDWWGGIGCGPWDAVWLSSACFVSHTHVLDPFILVHGCLIVRSGTLVGPGCDDAGLHDVEMEGENPVHRMNNRSCLVDPFRSGCGRGIRPPTCAWRSP